MIIYEEVGIPSPIDIITVSYAVSQAVVAIQCSFDKMKKLM